MIMNDTNTFSKIALDWWNHEKVTWTKDHAKPPFT